MSKLGAGSSLRTCGEVDAVQAMVRNAPALAGRPGISPAKQGRPVRRPCSVREARRQTPRSQQSPAAEPTPVPHRPPPQPSLSPPPIRHPAQPPYSKLPRAPVRRPRAPFPPRSPRSTLDGYTKVRHRARRLGSPQRTAGPLGRNVHAGPAIRGFPRQEAPRSRGPAHRTPCVPEVDPHTGLPASQRLPHPQGSPVPEVAPPPAQAAPPKARSPRGAPPPTHLPQPAEPQHPQPPHGVYIYGVVVPNFANPSPSRIGRLSSVASTWRNSNPRSAAIRARYEISAR